MHEMQTIVTDVRGTSVILSHAAHLGFTVRVPFGAAFAKSLRPLVYQDAQQHHIYSTMLLEHYEFYCCKNTCQIFRRHSYSTVTLYTCT